MSVIPCKTILKENRRAFGFNVGHPVPYSNRAWFDTQVKGGVMLQHTPADRIFSREPSSGGCDFWADSKMKRILKPPFRGAYAIDLWGCIDACGACQNWNYADNRIPQELYNLDDGNGERISMGQSFPVDQNGYWVDNGRCWDSWLHSMYYLWACNVVVRQSTEGGSGLVFDFSNSVRQWYKAEAQPVNPAVVCPERRPFRWPAGNPANVSYMHPLKLDFPEMTATSLWGILNDFVGMGGLNYFVAPNTGHVYSCVASDAGPSQSLFFDEHGLISNYYEDAHGDWQPTLRLLSPRPPSSASYRRYAGTYFDWSIVPAREKLLYWDPIPEAPSCIDLSMSGLPEVLMGSSSSYRPIPGSAFDMTLHCHVYHYVVLTMHYSSGSSAPPWTVSQGQKGWLGVHLSGNFVQMLPVAPKAR